jgi:hypothetical protein
MFIISLKLDKTKILATLAALCLVVAVACVMIPQGSDDVLSSNVSNVAKSIEDHIAFLNAYGYNVSDKPVRIQEVIIPSEFGDDYQRYNDFQKLSGFDLTKFKNYRVKQYTYKVTDYSDTDDEVVANILVHNNKVIGGDISSTTLGGFTHGFVKE